MAKLKGCGYSLEDLDNYDETHKRKSALEIFTDREEPREVFWQKHYNPLFEEMSNGKEQSEIHAIHYYGTTGVGKSTLLKKIADELGNKPFLLVDFRGFQGGKREAIVKIAIEIQEKFHFPMPFTAAADAWWAYLQRDASKLASPEKKTKDKMESNKFVGAGLYLLGFTPFGGIVGNVIDFVDYLETNYGINLSKSVKDKFTNKDIKRIQDEIKACDIQELDKRFHIYFGFDLSRFVSTLGQPLVIMFDTYEHFINPLGMKETYRNKDLWLRNETDGLVYNMSNVVWVLAGREKLGSIDDEERKDSWDKLDLDEHRIGPLGQEDSEKYLDSVGITDKGLRDYIVDISKGSPLHLDLCYARYNDLKGQEGRLDPASYADTIDSAIERFLERMTPEFVEFVETMSAFKDGWTDDMIDEINKEIPGFNLNLYNTLLRQNSMVVFSQINKRYMLEDNLQRVMYSKVAPNIVKKVDEARLTYYMNGEKSFENTLRLTKIVTSRESVSFSDFRKYVESKVFDLIFCLDYNSAFDILSLFEDSETYKTQADYSLYVSVSSLTAYMKGSMKGYLSLGESLLPNFDMAKFDMCDNIAKCFYYLALSQEHRFHGNNKECINGIIECFKAASNLNNDSLLNAIILHDRALAYGQAGEYSKALEFALMFYENVKKEKSDNEPIAIVAQLLIASFNLSLGNFEYVSGVLEDLYVKVKSSYGESYLSLEIENVIADCRNLLGEYQEVLELKKKVYNLKKEMLGESHSVSILALNDLATSYMNIGETDKAKSMFEDAVRKSMSVLGPRHQNTLMILSDLSDAYIKSGEYQEAVEILELVYKEQRKSLGDLHPCTIATLDSLAIGKREIHEYKTAFEMFETAYKASLNIWGEQNLFTIIALDHLASSYADIGDYQNALELGEKAYKANCELLGEDNADTIVILNNLANTYVKIENYQGALDAWKTVYEKWKVLKGESHPDTIGVLNNLAASYRGINDFNTALELFEKVYNTTLSAFGEHHPDTITALHKLAKINSEVGEHQKALKMFEDVYRMRRDILGESNPDIMQEILEERKELLGEHHPDTISALNDLAFLYRNEGEYKNALITFEMVYDQKLKSLGDRHPDTIDALNNLALAYMDVGECGNALDSLKKVYATRKELFGDNHPDTITALNNLAITYRNAGRHNDAFTAFKTVYETRRATLGEYHVDTISALSNLAVSIISLGEYQEALKILQNVFRMRKKLLGNMHTDTIMALYNISQTYIMIGKYRNATNAMKIVYDSWKKTLGNSHPNTFQALSDLAFLCREMGDYKKSLEICEKIYSIKKEAFGEEHPDTISALNSLALSYRSIGNFQMALEKFQIVYETRKKLFGEHYPDTLAALNNIAASYNDIGEYNRALKTIKKVYETRKKTLGEHHPDTISAYGNLAMAHRSVGDYQKALDAMKIVYAEKKETLGLGHPDTLIALGNLALAYKDVGRYQEAIEAMTEVYEARKEMLGDRHPDTMFALYNLAVSYRDAGDNQKALEMFDNAYRISREVLGESHSNTLKIKEILGELKNYSNETT